MKKSLLWILLLIIAGGAVIGYFNGWFITGKNTSKNDFQKVVVSRRDIGSTVIATGIIKPSVGSEVRVGSRVSGIVKKLHVNIGDHVREGQLLAELDHTELEARYNQAVAAVRNGQTKLEYAEMDVKRNQQLIKENFVSQRELDESQRIQDMAESDMDQSEANLDYARIQLGYTKIYAPISGVVASVSTQEGETVAASFSAPTFVTIIDLDRLEVWAYVDETDIGRITDGQQAFFTVDTYTDIDFEGTVTAIYPKAEIQDNVVNYITVLRITDHQGKILRPEMTTTVTIFLEKKTGVLAVPNSAIQREEGQKFAYVIQDDQIVKRLIEVGWKDKQYTEILKGLTEGEKVAIGDVDQLDARVGNQKIRRQDDTTAQYR
ncbi:MAG: efflux RND transporter periplasmic adaptor subunit [Deltaproteobacteria bacterium]|nr:efflux RND transporter periplasmic adaptor subunit [Deltaproteobacteria bacterium]